MDLDDLEHNTATGSTSPRWPAPGSPPSPASAGCATTAAGSRSPRGSPGRSRRLRFRIMFRGRSLLVDVNHEHAQILAAWTGEPLEIEHHGEPATLDA